MANATAAETKPNVECLLTPTSVADFPSALPNGCTEKEFEQSVKCNTPVRWADARIGVVVSMTRTKSACWKVQMAVNKQWLEFLPISRNNCVHVLEWDADSKTVKSVRITQLNVPDSMAGEWVFSYL